VAPVARAPRRRLRRWLLGVVGTLVLACAAFTVVVAVFDWNWARPWIRDFVMSRSGRRFDFDDLRIHLDRRLDPTVEFRGLTVQNASWAADPQPLIKAGRIAMTFEWRSLLSDIKVVRMIEIDDASIDMERQADGRRNWRITRPDDRGPPHLQVMALQARDSQLHLIHRGIALDLHARIERLAVLEASIGHPDLPLTQHLLAQGTFKDHSFDVDSAVSDVLMFGVTPQTFSLQGVAHVGGLTLQAHGVTNDIHSLGDLDMDAVLTSASGSTVWPLPTALSRVHPLKAQAHVTKIAVNWTVRQLSAHLGRHTALAGEVRYAGAPHSDARHTLNAALHDVVIDMDDVRQLGGPPPPKATSTAIAATEEGAKRAATEASVAGYPFSARPLAFARLRDFDADLDLRDARFTDDGGRALPQTLRLRATLRHGVLQLPSFDLGIAGGRVVGNARLDASQSPAALALDVRADHLRLDRLSPKLAAEASSAARSATRPETSASIAAALDGQATLQSQGDSMQALALAARGSFNASLAPGASISKRMDAKLSLDGGEWLRSLFDTSARVPVQCSVLSMTIAHGVATSRQFALETANTTLIGHGTFAFADAAIDATVMPIRKQHALLALNKAIHATGKPGAIRISLLPPLDEAQAVQAGRSPCR
jgi:uncharacterized protein involved in outer membrane biogenesis